MKKRGIMILVVGGLLFTTACSNDEKQPAPAVDLTVSFQVQERMWTYLQLESGQVVGTSALGDEAADAEWKKRTDWDIAFCGDLIRTNGGTSGNGEAAFQVVERPYQQVEEAPANGYQADTDDVEIW